MITRTCPLGHMCEACLWRVRLRGQNPQTGQEEDKDECAMAVLPILMVQASMHAYQTAGAVESLRNEVSQGNEAMLMRMIGPTIRSPQQIRHEDMYP